MKPIITANNLRDTVGVGTIINTHHEGLTKRPTETRSQLDELTSEDLGKSTKKESSMANPGFSGCGERR
jgi:hypothetical protein